MVRSGRKRQGMSPRLRFSIFERDGFTCQYCGGRQPYVTLHVDHRIPVVSGGTNDPSNLVTACSGCNLGKSAKKLAAQSTTSTPTEPGVPPHPLRGLAFLSYRKDAPHWQGEIADVVEPDQTSPLRLKAQLYSWASGSPTDVVLLTMADLAQPEGAEHWFKLFPDYRSRNAFIAKHVDPVWARR